MRKWVTNQLAAEGTSPVVVIDPDAIVTDQEIEAAYGAAEVLTVRDWFELRREWERCGRHRGGPGPRLVLVTRDPGVTSATDLAFDVERRSVVRRIRVPAPPAVRAAVTALDDEASDTAVARIASGSLDATDAVLTAAADLPAMPLASSPARQFQVALRLVDHAQPDAVLSLARVAVADPLALAVLDQAPRLDDVQDAWEEWLADPAGSRWSVHVRECRAELIDLFMAGRLAPAEHSGAEIPPWATVGVAQPTPVARVAALLDAPLEPPGSLDDWVRVAQWWGEVRSGLALVNPVDQELEARAWGWWRQADEQFLAWLRSSYGTQLTRTWANWPASLDKIQPFLAKRQVSSGRILTVILDGMGFTQWTRIRELASLRVAHSGGVLAMLPTLTEVSRQAIAAGGLPIQFADSLRSTSKEPQRWTAAWDDAGVSTAWVRIDGARSEEVAAIPFGEVDVIGLVLSATDELMHSAELLGDIGLHAGLDAWVRSGVLTTILETAADHGYETWLTADHGNLAVEPIQEPREGAFVERAGTRARRYASKTLRDAATVQGVVWDELPGYPAGESQRLLFAPGQTGWGPSRLSHGGLSLDEVIVPLVQIEPPS